MRTKTLLLIAAVGAASVASSMAQVYSVNAVGYVNTTVPAKGFALISNPLKAADNSISALFAGLPDGAKVYKYNTSTKNYSIFTYDASDPASAGFIQPTAKTTTVMPGEGVFVQNPDAQAHTITFVGEVPQGQLDTPLVAGFQIVSSQVPQAGTVEALGYVAADGDKVYQFNTTTQKYQIYSYDAGPPGEWNTPLGTLAVGEAVFLQKLTPGKWSRNFNVNQ